jgi:hypothetical protein
VGHLHGEVLLLAGKALVVGKQAVCGFTFIGAAPRLEERAQFPAHPLNRERPIGRVGCEMRAWCVTCATLMNLFDGAARCTAFFRRRRNGRVAVRRAENCVRAQWPTQACVIVPSGTL